MIVKNESGDLVWFENPGNPQQARVWISHTITKGKLPGAYDVALADLDKDGDLDVAASSWSLGNQFAWFENDGTPAQGEWTKHFIDVGLANTRTIRAADFDQDGDLDLLGTAAQANLVAWYENPGPPASDIWKLHPIDTCPGPMHGEPVDLDGDGDMDVVMAVAGDRGQVVWYENRPGPAGRDKFKRHLIRAPFRSAFEATAADLDADGDVDVVATGWGQPGRIAWFENHGDPRKEWTMHVLKDPWRRANQAIIVDLDGDGHLDIVACAEQGSLELRWWRNLGMGR